MRIVDRPQDWPYIAQFVASKIGCAPQRENITAIGLVDGDKLVAGVVYSDYNGKQITAGIAIDGKKINREFLWFMFFYPFKQLGVKRITVCVEQDNSASQQLASRLGFELESRMERAGKTGDILVYRMFRENCRYLEKCYEPRKIRPATPARLRGSS